jgi:caffeoyl-CoA O-methyltransferase
MQTMEKDMKQILGTGVGAMVFCLAVELAMAQPAPGGPPDSWGRSRGGRGVVTSSAPLPKDDAEKKILDVLEDMRQQGLGISVPRDDGRLLRILAESINAKNVVELGTFHGYSGLWFCLALRTTGGKLTTFEIEPRNAEISRANFKRAGVESLVTIVEGDAHKEVSRLKDPVDLVFIDAEKEGYLDYFNQLLPLVRPGGLIVAHNIDGGMANADFVKAITSEKAVDTVVVNAGSGGISVSMRKR